MRTRGWNIILKSSEGLMPFARNVSTKNLEKQLGDARLLYFVQSEERHEKTGIIFLHIRSHKD